MYSPSLFTGFLVLGLTLCSVLLPAAYAIEELSASTALAPVTLDIQEVTDVPPSVQSRLPVKPTPSTHERLTSIEQFLYGRSFAPTSLLTAGEHPDTRRLERIEQSLFSALQSGTLEDRLNRVQKTIAQEKHQRAENKTAVRLAYLEERFFQQSFPDDALQERLSRLEYAMFGQGYSERQPHPVVQAAKALPATGLSDTDKERLEKLYEVAPLSGREVQLHSPHGKGRASSNPAADESIPGTGASVPLPTTTAAKASNPAAAEDSLVFVPPPAAQAPPPSVVMSEQTDLFDTRKQMHSPVSRADSGPTFIRLFQIRGRQQETEPDAPRVVVPLIQPKPASTPHTNEQSTRPIHRQAVIEPKPLQSDAHLKAQHPGQPLPHPATTIPRSQPDASAPAVAYAGIAHPAALSVSPVQKVPTKNPSDNMPAGSVTTEGSEEALEARFQRLERHIQQQSVYNPPSEHYLHRLYRSPSGAYPRLDGFHVQYFVHTTHPLQRQWTEQALQQWQRLFTFEEVTSAADADIFLDWGGSSEPITQPMRMVTSGHTMRSVLYLSLKPIISQAVQSAQSQRYLNNPHPLASRAVAHQLGHALGLWGHSENPQDVMYAAFDWEQHDIPATWLNTHHAVSGYYPNSRLTQTPTLTLSPSKRDEDTLRWLYRLPIQHYTSLRP